MVVVAAAAAAGGEWRMADGGVVYISSNCTITELVHTKIL
jgi:hypothetical protein